jgi:hypothetical protein
VPVTFVDDMPHLLEILIEEGATKAMPGIR